MNNDLSALLPYLSLQELGEINRLLETDSGWHPYPGQQTAFFNSPAFEALFGGQAGPGKSEVLLMKAKEQVWHPRYNAILFRRTFSMLEGASGLIQRSLIHYPAYGGQYNAGKHYWTFPSGARIYFGHMQHSTDMYQYQSSEFTFIGWDELTEFEQSMYLYMFTRCRTSEPDLVPMIRAATNPGNAGHEWVKKRFITRDITNQIRHFVQLEDGGGKMIDTEVDADHRDVDGQPDALSRAFYPARMEDNPSCDPNYRMRIRATGDPVRIAQLEYGDWDAEYKEGLIYDTWSSLSWPDGNVTAEAEYRPDLPLYWACDDGYVYGKGSGDESYHPRVVLFVQDNGLGGLDVIDEYVACEENHETTLLHLMGPADGTAPSTPTRWQEYHRPTAAYIDSSAALFKGEMHKRSISTINATHPVTEGIKAVRALLKSGDGERRVRVHPRCQSTIYEFGVYRSDPNGRAVTGEVVPHKVDDHCMDALRYLIFKRRHMTG